MENEGGGLLGILCVNTGGLASIANSAPIIAPGFNVFSTARDVCDATALALLKGSWNGYAVASVRLTREIGVRRT